MLMESEDNIYESDDVNVPYVELELDIRDVRTILDALSFQLSFKDDISGIKSPEEKSRKEAMLDFLQRVVLEYNFKVEE